MIEVIFNGQRARDQLAKRLSMNLVERLHNKADIECIGDCTVEETRWWLNSIADELEEAGENVGEDIRVYAAMWIRSQAQENEHD